MTKNKLQELPHIQAPMLTQLILDENEIGECKFASNDSIKVLSLNKNKLKSLEGLARLYNLE